MRTEKSSRKSMFGIRMRVNVLHVEAKPVMPNSDSKGRTATVLRADVSD